ncbi:MAG: hypothetical protein H7039_13250 [Bryobacteraceae bacterium]|nr:hypothetical protein [Bryobacteraceae bacterium]
MTTPAKTALPLLIGDRAMTIILMVGFSAYIAITVGFAAYVLFEKFWRGVNGTENIVLAALIAVIGTGLTALSAVYGANRQVLAAKEVELLRVKTGTELAEIGAKLTGEIETLKADSAQTLERLKMYLDAEKIAYRELYGAAATYFFALRSTARNTWDDALLSRAETSMVEASRHLIYTTDHARNVWLAFWQEAQFIFRQGVNELDVHRRPAIIETEMNKQVSDGGVRSNFRDRYADLEQTIREAIQSEVGARFRPK